MSDVAINQEPPPPRWLEWVIANSQPKKITVKPEPRKLTPWQKRGPMKRKDWKRFYKWALKKAVRRPGLPRPIHERCTGIKLSKKRKGSSKDEETTDKRGKDKRGKDKRGKKKKLSLEELMERINKLSRPRYPRRKYVLPETPDYPYAPKIHHDKPAKKDKGRPFEPVKKPRDFQHIELETEFWFNVRFPVRPQTRNYKPTQNMLKLAAPKVSPPVTLHCALPEPEPEYVAPRRRFTHCQWKRHLRRLEYLARPARPHCFLYELRFKKPPLLELCPEELILNEEEMRAALHEQRRKENKEQRERRQLALKPPQKKATY